MSLVDRWLTHSVEIQQAATSATSATSSRNLGVSANFRVATGLRHIATLPQAPILPPPMSQPVAEGLRHENPPNTSIFEPLSQMSQMSRAPVPDAAEPWGFNPLPINSRGEAENGRANDPTWWHDEFSERAAQREYGGGYPRAEAEALAWDELENRWNIDHGERVPRDICAGCRRPIGGAPALDLIDGNRVHLADGYECLISHGERWRGAATRALITMGLVPPDCAG